jgi:lipopolysaccharide export system protein LptA
VPGQQEFSFHGLATGGMNIPLKYTAMVSRPTFLKFLFFMIIVSGSLTSYGQVRPVQSSQDTTSPKFIIIDHFGKLIEDKEGIEAVKWISQGLQLRVDSTYIYADSAVIFGEDRVYAYGNVVIQQGDSLNVFTDTLYYFKETDVADLIGEVALEQGTKQLWTKNLTYHLGEQYGEYTQGGILVDQSLQVSSKQGIYYAADEEVIFKDSVVVLHPEFNLAADSMHYLAAESRVIFTGPTNIYTPTAEIYCESGFYDLASETAEFNSHAQYAGEQKKATADTIRYNSGMKEVLMLGNVHVAENEKRIDGDYLRYLEQSGETWISGDPAKYVDSTRKVNSPEIFYNEKTNQVTTKGRGAVTDGPMQMEFDHSDFDQGTGIGKFSGKVMWRDTVSNVGIFTDTMDVARGAKYVLAYGINRSLFFTLVDGDTLYIAADTLNMESRADTSGTQDTSRIIRAYHDVRLFKSDMQGKADSLVFNDTDSLFSFFGDPVLWSDTTQFSADSITMSIKNSQVNDIMLTQKAIIISELYGTYYDQIKGKTILAQFDSSAIKDMWVTGNAESVYYTRDEQSAFIGVNKTICSKMYFTFLEGQIDVLKYYGENSSSMMPMNEAKHDTLRLEGFRWRSAERPLGVTDLLK